MNYRDAPNYRKCLDCDARVLPPRRKCNSCRKSVAYTVSTLKPSRAGYNKRGTALHRPTTSHTRRAKRQNPQVLGSRPNLVQSRL
jgi:uncharacterized OB-fold protein